MRLNSRGEIGGWRTSAPGPQALADWRLRMGVSRQELADLLGLKHQASIYLYETGRQPLTLVRLLDLQSLTGISIWTLASPGQRMLMTEIVRSAPAAVAQAAAAP